MARQRDDARTILMAEELLGLEDKLSAARALTTEIEAKLGDLYRELHEELRLDATMQLNERFRTFREAAADLGLQTETTVNVQLIEGPPDEPLTYEARVLIAGPYAQLAELKYVFAVKRPQRQKLERCWKLIKRHGHVVEEIERIQRQLDDPWRLELTAEATLARSRKTRRETKKRFNGHGRVTA